MKKFFLLTVIIFSLIPIFAQEADILPSPDGEVSVENELSTEQELPPERNPARLADPRQRGDFWVSPGAETAFFSSYGISVGSSLAVAYGSKTSMGFKATWFFDMHKVLDVLELNFLLRYYFMGRAPAAENAFSVGPFLQLTGGPSLFFEKAENVSIPAKWGTVSAGLTFGWRFLFGKFIFTEPYIRAGYPYIAGAGVSGGVRF